MPWPWPSFGGFLFKHDEQPVWGTDAGWALSPAYYRAKPFGSTTDVITAIAIGSAERTFEMYFTPRRFLQLQLLLNTRAIFTDWDRPADSRMAFLSGLEPIENAISANGATGSVQKSFIRKRKAKVTLVSA